MSELNNKENTGKSDKTDKTQDVQMDSTAKNMDFHLREILSLPESYMHYHTYIFSDLYAEMDSIEVGCIKYVNISTIAGVGEDAFSFDDLNELNELVGDEIYNIKHDMKQKIQEFAKKSYQNFRKEIEREIELNSRMYKSRNAYIEMSMSPIDGNKDEIRSFLRTQAADECRRIRSYISSLRTRIKEKDDDEYPGGDC